MFHPELQNPVDLYTKGTFTVFDVETTNLMKGDGRVKENRLVMSGYARGGDLELRIGDEYNQKKLITALDDSDFVVAHGGKFDLRWARRCGLDLTNPNLRLWDTLLAEKVLLGNLTKPLGLDACLARRGLEGKDKLVSNLIKGGVCPSQIPPKLLSSYQEADVLGTYALFHSQLEEALEKGLVPVIFTRCLITVPLTDIEEQGMWVDSEALNKLIERTIEEYQQLDSILKRDHGEINFNSPPQVRKLLFDDLGFKVPTKYGKPLLTPKGELSTSEPAIHALKPTTTDQRNFLKHYKDFKKIASKLSKYLTKLQLCVEEDEGHLFANFNQAVTVTHRLSSSGFKYGIQFQNMDRNLKPLFWAGKEGWLIGEADMAQLEFRIAAELTGDQQALKDIVEKRDVHTATRDYITSHGQRIDRQEAKNHTFKPLFAGMSGTKAEVEYYDYFRKRYHVMADAQKQWAEEALVTKRLVTPWGLIFYFPHARRTKSGWIEGCTNMYNYPIQSLATADVVQIGMAYFWHKINELGLEMRIVNTVHDSVVAIFPEKERELFEELAVECMVTRPIKYLRKIYGMDFKVPLEVEAKCSRNWNG